MGGVGVLGVVTIRQRAEDMPPTKAVDYLLGCLEDLADAWMGGHHPVDDHIPGLPTISRRVAIRLWDNAGRIVTVEQLQATVNFGQDWNRPASVTTVRTHVHRLRARLPTHVTIETVYGAGYRMNVSRTRQSG